MAEHKKGFMLYADQKELFAQLPNELAGRLIKHIFEYVNDESPETEDLLLKIAFTPIKLQLKRDLIKWSETKSGKSESGSLGNLKRWNIDLYNDVISNKKTLKESLIIAKHRTATKSIANIAVNDNVTVTVKDTVKKENKIGKIQEEFYSSLIPFVEKFGKEEVRNFYAYWSEPNKSGTKIRYQLEKTWDANLRLHRWTKNNFKQNGETKRKDEGFKKEFFIHRAEG